jgi:hypothetical protein
MPLFLRRDIGFDTNLAANSKTIRQFDDAITRVAFGGLKMHCLHIATLGSMLQHGWCEDERTITCSCLSNPCLRLQAGRV